jgi:hypothetical protein
VPGFTTGAGEAGVGDAGEAGVGVGDAGVGDAGVGAGGLVPVGNVVPGCATATEVRRQSIVTIEGLRMTLLPAPFSRLGQRTELAVYTNGMAEL